MRPSCPSVPAANPVRDAGTMNPLGTPRSTTGQPPPTREWNPLVRSPQWDTWDTWDTTRRKFSYYPDFLRSIGKQGAREWQPRIVRNASRRLQNVAVRLAMNRAAKLDAPRGSSKPPPGLHSRAGIPVSIWILANGFEVPLTLVRDLRRRRLGVGSPKGKSRRWLIATGGKKYGLFLDTV
jgi:hypothetical protein